MRKLRRSSWMESAVFAAASLAFAGLALLTAISGNRACAQPLPTAAQEQEPAPPAGQTYIGSKQCSSCHFEAFMSWKKTNHSKAYENMPAKYKGADGVTCFACHITGYGHPGGYTREKPDLLGVTCEACHGPGSKHQEIAKQFAEVKQLSPEQEKAANDSIWKIMPGNVCAQCHISQGHKEHPKYDKQ